MELEDVRCNLHALIKLYGLLQSSEEESLLNASSVNNLLDRATERVFDAHLKIIAAQSSISNKTCSTPPEQSDATRKLQPPASRKISKASPTVLKRPSKDLNFHTNASPKDEQSLTKAMPEGMILELSKASIPPTKPESRKKRCRVFRQSSMNQPSLARGKTISHENIQIPNSCGNGQDQQEAHVQWETGLVKGLAPKKNVVDSVGNIEMSRQKRIREIKCNSSAVKSLASSSCASVTGFVKPSGEQNLAGATDKNLEDVDYISKEVADAIKRIKSRLQALQPPAAVVDPLNEKNPADKGSCRKASSISIADKVHPAVETKEEIVTRSELSQAGGGSALSGNVLSSRQFSQSLHKFNDSGPANNVVSQSQKPISVASDLQSQAASQEPLRKSNDLLSQLGSQKNGNRGTTTLPGNALNMLMKKPTGEGLDLPNQYDAKSVKAIVEKIESLSRLKSENDRLPSHVCNYVHGLRVSPSQVKLGQGSTFIAKMPSRVNKENTEQDPMPQNETTGNSSTSTPSLLPRSLDPIDFVLPNRKTQVVRPRHKMNQTQARALNRKNNLPYQAIMRPTLLDCNSSKIMVQPTLYDERTEDQKVRGIHKNIHLGPQSRIVRRQQISEKTSSSSGSSSSRTSQQTNTSCSESESESQGYLPPRRRGSQLSGSASRRSGRVVSLSSSSGESISSSHGRGSNYSNVGSSRRDYPKTEFRTEGRMNPEKQTGQLRRLKNKLGLVFHHHHHHHHHSHNNDDDSDHAEAAHAMPLWTHMKKIFHHSNKKKVYDDHSVKKSRKKAVVSNVPSKNQQGQFHSLAEDLMRHVRHSKKSKHSKGGIGRLGNDQHGHNKKVVKKLHWWKMLKRKRGVKLSNKGRVKVGYTS